MDRLPLAVLFGGVGFFFLWVAMTLVEIRASVRRLAAMHDLLLRIFEDAGNREQRQEDAAEGVRRALAGLDKGGR